MLLAGALLVGCGAPPPPTLTPTGTASVTSTATPAPSATPTSPPALASHTILVDDFIPQPLRGQSVYLYNRLGGDRGAINDAVLAWGQSQVTTTISAGNSWGGVWMSLNHPIRQGLPINFSAVLPAQILPAYQSLPSSIEAMEVGGRAWEEPTTPTKQTTLNRCSVYHLAANSGVCGRM